MFSLKKRRQQLLLGNYHNTQGATPAELVDTYITDTLAPMLYYKFDEASGNLINYGSETGANGVVSGATQAQMGQLGAGEAVAFDGVDDVITIANANIPNVKALTTQRTAVLIKPASSGENGAGQIISYGKGVGQSYSEFNTLARFNVLIGLSTMSAQSQCSVDQIADCIGAWCWLFWDYDDTNELGLGRKIRLWKGIGGTLSPLTYQTNIAGVGTIVSQTLDLRIGNLSALNATMDGLYDVGIVDSGLWTTDEMQELIDLSGV